MDDSFYQSILEETATAYTYHRILLDDGGAPSDFVYLEVGPTVARFTGLRPDAAIGRRASDVLPAWASEAPVWVRRFGEVARTGRPADFDGFPPFTAIPCSLHVYSPQRGYFVVLYRDLPVKAPAPVPVPDAPAATSNPVARALAALSDTLRDGVPDDAAGRSVADVLLRLGDARYAAYHRLLPDGAGFETVAVSGVPLDTLSALGELGVRLVGRRWTWCADGAARIPRQGSVVFPDAPALASALLPASLGALASGLGTGEAVLAGIPSLLLPGAGDSLDPDPPPAGFFTLLMPAGRPFTAHDAILALAGVVGGHLARRRALALLRESEDRLAILSDSAAGLRAEQLGTVFDLSVCALFLIRVQGDDFRYERANPRGIDGR